MTGDGAPAGPGVPGGRLRRSANSVQPDMKLTIERAALLKALSHVQSVVERRTTIPILSNVLLRAEAGRLALSATDMDLEIVERVAAPGRARGPHHRAGAHALRHRPQTARGRAGRDRDAAASATRWCCAPAARPSRSPACRRRTIR